MVRSGLETAVNYAMEPAWTLAGGECGARIAQSAALAAWKDRRKAWKVPASIAWRIPAISDW